MGMFDYFKRSGTPVEVKALDNSKDNSGVDIETKNSDIFKAYIPNFLYKPPYGMPRQDNTPQQKMLAKNPYVFSVIKTLCDEATSNGWEVKVKDGFQDDGVDYTDKIKDITKFLRNPNGNEESLQHLLRQIITDLLETDSAVLVKVFDHKKKMTQMFSRDGSLFLKNPDIYGYIGNRADFVLPLPDGFTGVNIDFGGTPTVSQQQIMKTYSLLYKEDAAYFQYGWTAGSMPIPFGKREIIYMMQMPRSDSIYGTSPTGRLLEIIMNLIYGADFNLDFYINNNMPDGAISLIGATNDVLKNFKENFVSKFTFKDKFGNNRKKFNKMPVSTSEIKFTPFSFTAKDMEVMAQQKWFTKVMWMCYGVNAEEMGFTEDSNKSTSEVQIKAFKRKAIKPILDVISYHFNTQLLTEFFDNADPADVPLEFVFDEYDVQEDTAKHTLLEQQIRMGIKTPMMVAEELGIDTVELEKGMVEKEEKEMAMIDKQNGFKEEGNDNFNKKEDKPKKKEPEEKAESNPLGEIEKYIDTIGEDIEIAVGNLNENELRV